MRGRESRRCSMEWAWALQTYFKSLAWRVAAFANVVGDRNKGRKDNAETLRCQSYTEKAEVTNLWVAVMKQLPTRHSADGDEGDAGADQGDSGPAAGADFFAEEIFCCERAEDVGIERGCGDDEADGLPGKKKQERVEAGGEERDAGPEPGIAQRAAEEGEDFARSKAHGFTGDFHGVGDDDFAGGATEDEDGEHDDAADHAATRSWAMTSVVRGLVRPTVRTPAQISATPIQRRGETASWRKMTARRVTSA